MGANCKLPAVRFGARGFAGRALVVVPFLLSPGLAVADPPANVADALTRLEADLGRAAPDAAARSLAGHFLGDASRAIAQAKDLVRRGKSELARPLLPLLALRVRLVSLAVDAGRLQSMARERERRALTLLEEARVSRAAFEQAVERRIALEQAPPSWAPEPSPAPQSASPGSMPATDAQTATEARTGAEQ